MAAMPAMTGALAPPCIRISTPPLPRLLLRVPTTRLYPTTNAYKNKRGPRRAGRSEVAVPHQPVGGRAVTRHRGHPHDVPAGIVVGARRVGQARHRRPAFGA